jgi:hypothetical protein
MKLNLLTEHTDAWRLAVKEQIARRLLLAISMFDKQLIKQKYRYQR